MISINYRDARPIYTQVKDGLRKLILTGALAPGTRLPSVRELAAELAINPTPSSAPTVSWRQRGRSCPSRARGRLPRSSRRRTRRRCKAPSRAFGRRRSSLRRHQQELLRPALSWERLPEPQRQ